MIATSLKTQQPQTQKPYIPRILLSVPQMLAHPREVSDGCYTPLLLRRDPDSCRSSRLRILCLQWSMFSSPAVSQVRFQSGLGTCLQWRCNHYQLDGCLWLSRQYLRSVVHKCWQARENCQSDVTRRYCSCNVHYYRPLITLETLKKKALKH